MREINQDNLTKPINSLCYVETLDPKSIHFPSFQLAQPLESILEHYYYLSSVHYSDFFQIIWSSKLREISKMKSTLTIADVGTRIWKPVFSDCSDLIKKVSSKSIKLKEVDYYFRQAQADHIYDNLLNLFTAIEACNGNTPDSFVWIRQAVHLIKQYWSLCKQAEAASTLLELKDSLKLTGNFDVIESVANKVTTSMADASLDSIDHHRFVEAKSFLEQFTKDKEKLECLQVFATCVNIVEWIRKETKGMYRVYFLYCMKV